ncbi:DNA topoisomerase IB [Sphingomonas japonica]|uniref:DNA topoisomerase n=1 Tax=Sphingomonas japonica TaxID=511662 RepID=A0ABX0TZJ5_9SPHN|nr:DNA topoisomerase IB [Sphingomonas japonica]NIJ23746.1 DNA topoisomerase-1 [Sphingomonas japonica]
MAAKIHFVECTGPGITRRKVRGGWGYWNARGERITDRDEIDRLNAIGLPPAYTEAWFCPTGGGHIQAIGYDDKGRRQYRYHPQFREAQEAAKYDLCAAFGNRLPALRKAVERDLRKRSLSKERAVAAVVRLLDLGHVRIGNEGYAKANKSFGATTLRKRHAKLGGSTLKLQYTAKSGKLRVLTITDRSLIGFVRKCQDLPGQHLFRWLDDAGEAHAVTSSDVNDYIHAAMGDDFTAKHFRTWGASAIAFETLVTAQAPIGLKAMLEPVTQALGNTPAIARKSYVHPQLVDLAKDKAAQAAFVQGLKLPRTARYLTRAERGLIAFLERDAARPEPHPAKAA